MIPSTPNIPEAVREDLRPKNVRIKGLVLKSSPGLHPSVWEGGWGYRLDRVIVELAPAF